MREMFDNDANFLFIRLFTNQSFSKTKTKHAKHQHVTVTEHVHMLILAQGTTMSGSLTKLQKVKF